jgi:hypothetical protein
MNQIFLKKNISVLQQFLSSYDIIIKYNIREINSLPCIKDFTIKAISTTGSKNDNAMHIFSNIKKFFLLYTFFAFSPKISNEYTNTQKKGQSQIENCFFQISLRKKEDIYAFLFNFFLENENKIVFNYKANEFANKKSNKITSITPIMDLQGIRYLLLNPFLKIDLKEIFLKIEFETLNSSYKNTHKNFPLFWNS